MPPGQAVLPAPPRLLDRLREALRVRHYAHEQAYVDWARRYILFNGKRHPGSWGPTKSPHSSLTWRSSARGALPTQNQAKSALLFLYRAVLARTTCRGWTRSSRPRTRGACRWCSRTAEVRALLHELSGTMGLVASLLYGTGMRLLEACACG